MPQWYLKILLVRVVTGNIFKFRGSLEILFKIINLSILNYNRNIMMALGKTQRYRKNLTIKIILSQAPKSLYDWIWRRCNEYMEMGLKDRHILMIA